MTNIYEDFHNKESNKKQIGLLKFASEQEYCDYLKTMLFTHNYYLDYYNNSFNTIFYTNTFNKDTNISILALKGWELLINSFIDKHSNDNIILNNIVWYDNKFKKHIKKLSILQKKDLKYSSNIFKQLWIFYIIKKIKHQEAIVGKHFFNYIEFLKTL